MSQQLKWKSRCPQELPSPEDLPPVVGLSADEQEITQTRDRSAESPFSALAFKVQADPHMGKLVYFRVYSGKIEAGTYVYNVTKGKKERVGSIALRRY